MKYNEKYDRYVTKGGLVYRYDGKKDRLIQCRSTNSYGYLCVGVSKPKRKIIRVHRLVYETFVGAIPQGYVIDHINTIRDDNRIENLRCVTCYENNNNPLTRKHFSEAKKGNTYCKGKTHSEETKKKISEAQKSRRHEPSSEFGRKFKEHYGITHNENPKLYNKERLWYRHHNKCRWEREV